MQKFSSLILTFFLVVSGLGLMAQPTTQTNFFGTFTFESFSAGGTSDVTGVLNAFNDQTNTYFANNIQVGDVIWDNLGNRWEVIVVNSSNLTQADVDLRDINSVGGTPFGTGFVTRETPNYGLSLFVPDNNIGISQQLKSRVESHNTILIDAAIAAAGGGITVTDGNTIDHTLTGSDLTSEVIVSPDAGNALENRANGSFVPASQGVLSVYNSGQGFWVYGTAGVTTALGAQGTYNVDIPSGAQVISMWYDIDVAGDLTVGGEAIVNIDHNTGAFNTSFANALLPTFNIIDSGGVQRNPGDVSVTVTSSTPSAGATSTTLANLNGLGFPHRLKIQF